MDNATLIDTPEMRFALQFAKKAGILIRSRFSLDVSADWKDNETPLTVTDTEINDDFIKTVAKEFPGYSILGEEASKPLEQGCVPLLMNAIQYGSALTCAGRGAGVVFSLPSFWDAAPSYTIATEAGGVMTDLYGNQQRYDRPTNGFIMANPTIHQQLLQMVAKYLK